MKTTQMIVPYTPATPDSDMLMREIILELKAREVKPNGLARVLSSMKQAVRQSDTLFVRIALPPLALWAVLYSLVEYIV